MKHPIQHMMDQRREGKICGIESVCSANGFVLEVAFKLENFDMPVITSILDKLMVFPPWYNALYNSSSGIFVPVMSRS